MTLSGFFLGAKYRCERGGEVNSRILGKSAPDTPEFDYWQAMLLRLHAFCPSRLGVDYDSINVAASVPLLEA